MKKGYAIFRGNNIVLWYCPTLTTPENNKLRASVTKRIKKDGPFYLAIREENDLFTELDYV